MSKFIVVDLNRELVEEVTKLGIEAHCYDYFLKAYATSRPVLLTASNPQWTFGGGIDHIFTKHFPILCRYKQVKGGEMERIANVVFTITVDDKLRASKEQVEKAISFALDNTYEGETLVIHGVGTGIGGMSVQDFCEIIRKI